MADEAADGPGDREAVGPADGTGDEAADGPDEPAGAAEPPTTGAEEDAASTPLARADRYEAGGFVAAVPVRPDPAGEIPTADATPSSTPAASTASVSVNSSDAISGMRGRS